MITDIVAPQSNAVTSQLAYVPDGISPEVVLRYMTARGCLYREGDPRTYVHRVEQGVVAVYEDRVGRPNRTETLSQKFAKK